MYGDEKYTGIKSITVYKTLAGEACENNSLWRLKGLKNIVNKNETFLLRNYHVTIDVILMETSFKFHNKNT
jgi:hypothetical protein